ncbi:MAG: hypothetical protein BZ137_04225 [Methanosphaera sp. rholeuAM130]|nr:MAG: hypothetical protein BZ137_04225 [Methanosphaera sp. rholeuAM130]
MIDKISNNLENEKLLLDDVKYLLFSNDDCTELFYQKAMDINKEHHDKIDLETKIFYPLLYSVKSNCPTCGYQTPESHRKYNPAYIESVIKYNIDIIKSYDISKINCLHMDNYKYYERELFLKILNKYDMAKAVKINTIQDLDIIEKYDYDSLIIDSQNTKVFNSVQENKELRNDYNITANLEIYNNNLKENINFINNLNNLKVDSIEIVGYDPFYDDVHEYNPQYTKEYLKKVVSILKIFYPNLELKISYATNGNNHFEEVIPLGINSINGIYCNKINKLYNIENITDILQKMEHNEKK